MAWGDWMCPTLEPHHLLTLEQQARAIASYDLPQAQQVLRDLSRLLCHQDLIIRNATRRIAELECRLGLEAMD
jgi:hypothetical protein